GQLEPMYQVGHIPLRFRGYGQRGDLDPAPSGMLREAAPSTADVQDTITRLRPAGFDRKIELAALGCLERLIIPIEQRLRIAAGRVHELEIELAAQVVMSRDRLTVRPVPPDQDRREPPPQ